MSSNRQFIADYQQRQAARFINPQPIQFMTSSRLKAPSLTSRIEFERCVDDLARTTVALRKLEARRDEKIQSVRAEWDPTVREAVARASSLTLLVEKYAEDHRDELLPGKIKSAETPLALYGFRLGNPTLKLLNRRCSWLGVVAAAKLLGLHRFVRMTEEADKEAIKSANLPREQLEQLGVKIEQSETFYVEPKEQPSDIAKAS